MSSTVVIHGFPAELCREPMTMRQTPSHAIRDGIAYRARRGILTPAADAGSSTSSTPAISRSSSRKSVGERPDSLGPSSSLTSGGTDRADQAPSRFAVLYGAAADKVSALLAPKQTSGARIRPPAGCCR